MPRKAKPTKHSRKDLEKRRKRATTDKGGGKKGREERGGGKTGGAKFQCYVCFKNVPDAKTMQIHFENKHSKLPFDMVKCTVQDTKKDHDAARARIRLAGPSLVAGKAMQRSRKKNKGGEAETSPQPVMRGDRRRELKEKQKKAALLVEREEITEVLEALASVEEPKKKKKKKKKKKATAEDGQTEEEISKAPKDPTKKKKKKKKKKDKEGETKAEN